MADGKKGGENKIIDVDLIGQTAVALVYDKETGSPKVIAKGIGYIAEKIINTAKKENIPVHEDPALASTLGKLKLGDNIPPELYEVVAQIYLFVGRLEAVLREEEEKGEVRPF